MQFTKRNRFGKGGKRPNAGRPPSEVRAASAKGFEDRLPILFAIADDPQTAARDRIAAIALMARIGLPDQHEHSGFEPPQFFPITFDGDKQAKGDENGKAVANN